MTVIAIDELDLGAVDEATVAGLAELDTVEEAERSPGDPPVVAGEVADHLRIRPEHQELALWVARDPGGRLLGRASYEIEHRADNQHVAEVYVVVRPDARRQGIGRRLLDATVERARRDGRTTLLGDAVVGGDGAAAVRAVGGESAIVHRVSRLRPADLDRDLLETWVARAPERAAGYSLVAFDDRCPDDLLEGFAQLQAVMNTAPRGDMDVEDEVFTPALVRSNEAAWEARGAHVWVVAARHDDTGDLVGYTALFFFPHRPWQAEQDDTGVDPAHRDRGLGRWLKAVNLLRLLDERPAVVAVDTENASENAAMLGINVPLGFRPLAETETVQLRLP